MKTKLPLKNGNFPRLLQSILCRKGSKVKANKQINKHRRKGNPPLQVLQRPTLCSDFKNYSVLPGFYPKSASQWNNKWSVKKAEIEPKSKHIPGQKGAVSCPDKTICICILLWVCPRYRGGETKISLSLPADQLKFTYLAVFPLPGGRPTQTTCP